MKSSSREDVVQCLKNTPRGRLRYGAKDTTVDPDIVVHEGGKGRPSSQNGGPVSMNHDYLGDKLIVSVNSPPNKRNSNCINPENPFANRKKNIEENAAVYLEGGSLKNQDDEKAQCFPSSKQQIKTVELPKQCLYVSNQDSLGLINNYKVAMEEKVREEVKFLKINFLAGFEQIEHALRRTDNEKECTKLNRYETEVLQIDETLRQIQIGNDETLQNLKSQHEKTRLLNTKIRDGIRQKQNEIENEKKSQEEARKLKISLSRKLETLSLKVRDISLTIFTDLEPYKQNPYLPDDVKSIFSDTQMLYSNAMTIAKNAVNQQSKLNETCEFLEKTIINLESCKIKVTQEVAKASAKWKEDQQRVEQKVEEQKVAKEEQLKAEKEKTQQASAVLATVNISSTLTEKNLSQAQAMKLFVEPEAFQTYQEVLQIRQKTADSYTQFVAIAEKKAYRFDLMKAINTPINAISDQSPDHLIDKIERLTKLLKGDMIEVGPKRISVKNDSDGLAFCMDTIAKKLVLQGARQISSSFNSAFPFGVVALGIWSKFPEVGKLILAHLYLACPYLVPYYVPKKSEQSTAEYCKMLGYVVNGEEVESEENYLKKLSGVVRLYASIIQSHMPPQLVGLAHPHGLHNGWTWLARLINLEPRQTVTATILFDFLEVAGYSLSKEYGKQFQKLLHVLCSDFLQKIDKVTPDDQKGPVVRLKIFLEKCIKNNSIPIAEGYLPPRWWNGGGLL